MYKGTFQKYCKTWCYDQREISSYNKASLTNKGMITGNEISLKQGDSVTYKEGKVAQFLNNTHTYFAENTTKIQISTKCISY